MKPLENVDLETRGHLTSREIEVLRMTANGLRNREISSALLISEGTVKAHLHSIFRKLGLTSRVELALMARDRFFFDSFPTLSRPR